MPSRATELYERDFYAWTQDQAGVLRRLLKQRWNGSLDEIDAARDSIAARLVSALRNDIELQLSALYGKTRRRARAKLARYGEPQAAEEIPEVCPNPLERVLEEGWYAAGPQGC
jgi:hypothetical protein